MAGYHVHLRIRRTKPAQDELLFLGPLKATAHYAGERLQVSIDIEAADLVTALGRALELVRAGIDGEVELATVAAVDGVALPPGRVFGKRFNR